MAEVRAGCGASERERRCKSGEPQHDPTAGKPHDSPKIAAEAVTRRPTSCAGAADRQTVHAQGWLADADRNTLSVLAAGADPLVEAEVVADHGDFGQSIGSIADQRGALNRGPDLAVLNQIGL